MRSLRQSQTQGEEKIMDEEHLEDINYENKLIKDVLGMDFEQFERYKRNCVEGLIKFGDVFLQNLGHALQHATIPNAVRILNVWQRECVKLELFYRIEKAKEDAYNRTYAKLNCS